MANILPDNLVKPGNMTPTPFQLPIPLHILENNLCGCCNLLALMYFLKLTLSSKNTFSPLIHHVSFSHALEIEGYRSRQWSLGLHDC